MQRGLNRANWDLRYDAPIPPEPGESTGGFGDPPPGPRVLPGTYTVKVMLGDHEATRSVSVSDDPNVHASSSDRRAHLDYLLELRRLISEMHEAHQMAADLDEQLTSLDASLEKADTVPESVTTALAAAKEKVGEAAKLLSRNEGRSRFGGGGPRPLFQRMSRNARAVDGYTEAPSAKQKSQLTAFSRELTERKRALDAAVSGEVAELNRAIEESAVPRILARPVGRPTSQ